MNQATSAGLDVGHVGHEHSATIPPCDEVDCLLSGVGKWAVMAASGLQGMLGQDRKSIHP